MKKCFLFFFLLSFIYGFSQDNIDFKKNELKINAVFLIAGAVEITYERILNDESSIGITGFVAFDNDIDINYAISPFYRFYFGKKPAAGFFVEGFGSLNSIEDEFFEDFISDDSNTVDVVDFALGIGVGGKFITKRNFIAEISFGIGRNLFNTNDRNFDVFAKGGISLGFRF